MNTKLPKREKNDLKSDMEKYAEFVTNMPVECAACRKPHPKEGRTIQYIKILGDKREPVCNVDCAIKLIDRWEHQYAHMISDLRTRRMELEAERDELNKTEVKRNK